MAESVIGLYKTEWIDAKRPCRTPEEVEFATLEVDRLVNNRRL